MQSTQPSPLLTHKGFTLIELLVVVTIIVVLLALLVPAMDKAIYQAELVKCGANLHAMGSGAQTYAVGYRRSYPYRANVHARGWKPNVIQVATDASSDERPVMRAAFGAINPIFSDPLLPEVDYEGSKLESNIEINYALWFGFGFRGNKGMFKLGDRFGWEGATFDFLAGDQDYASEPTATPAFLNSHPDDLGAMQSIQMQDEGAVVPLGPGHWTQYTISRWQITNGVRGKVDKNYATSDGAVIRFTGVGPEGEGHIRVPATADPTQKTATDQFLPRR